jgi:molybdopterin-containing oxidoreductase family iron-sulfur binding subunit
VRSHWREWLGGGSQRGRGRTEADFEQFWTRALHDGIVEGTALPPTRTQVSPGLAKQFAQPRQSEGLEIAFRPDPAVWDGRFANNSYLQELPKPITTLTWDAAAYVSPNTAGRLGVQEQDLVELRYRGRTAPFPVLIVPGQADDCVTVLLGYGRRQGARRLGFNAYPLRTSDAPWWDGGLSIRKTGERYRLAMTQLHKDMAGRFPVRMGTLGTYEKDPHFAHKHPFEPAPRPSLTLYPEWRYEGYKWGMAIDLNACVGCQACVVACDLENNIPVVGKNEVLRGREMHWLRIDNYYQGSPHNPRVWFQPVLCMHCENAPCELVCPVNATVHSSEGLNQMVYNRCVGTRYCSNNCPYKVRRFNFFLYSDWASDSLTLMRNPEVTVRSRGVMEKCTYCVQRIQHAKIEAEKEDRPIRDGDVKTACQQACPTEAIVFGDLNNKESRVFRMKKQPLDYGLLDELNTRPRTTYLARIVNLNPEIEPELPHHG